MLIIIYNVNTSTIAIKDHTDMLKLLEIDSDKATVATIGFCTWFYSLLINGHTHYLKMSVFIAIALYLNFLSVSANSLTCRVNDHFSDTSIFRQPYYRVEKGTESRLFTEMIRPFCGTCSQKMKLLRPMTWTYKLKCTTV